MLGNIRSKFTTIPIPGNNVTLNGPALVSEAKAEQTALRDELKEILAEMEYPKLAEETAQEVENTIKTMQGVPLPVFVG